MKLRLALIFTIPALIYAGDSVQFSQPGHTGLGEWTASAQVSPAAWKPGDTLAISATLTLTDAHVAAFTKLASAPDTIAMLVTAERTFDSDGILRLSSDERMSTLLTPTGLAIEGGVQGAVSKRFNGYTFSTPVDLLTGLPFANGRHTGNAREFSFTQSTLLAADLPPGIYRVRLDFGFVCKGRYYSLNGEEFAYRPTTKGDPNPPFSHVYSPIIRASGKHVSGRQVDAAKIQPRVPWVLLANYNSNGYQGVVADEDSAHFALSVRNIIPDDVILPLVDSAGRKLAYNLEPQFPADNIDVHSVIPWNAASGQYTVDVTGPDGTVTHLGSFPFVGKNGNWPTTRQTAITAWKPPAYGQYTVSAKGWILDTAGNRYEGGGTYHFWIANRMTMATATFQGLSYAVGGRYGRDMAFNPPLPADVDFTATLLPNSDKSKAITVHCSGKASKAGVYGSLQGMTPLNFTAAGEYYAHVVARAVDAQGNLWVSSMRHAGVVYPPDSPIEAHGKKLLTGKTYADRGNTNLEGYVDKQGNPVLQHINFPYNSGDVLLIAAEGTGANKVEPVLTWDYKNSTTPYDTTIQPIGKTNVRLETSNGLSPHMFPEYITTWSYYYGAAPRPGFMARFLVADDGTRAPYWPTTNTSVGGQIGAHANGDSPGDIYRLIGGVVVRKQGADPMYAGYLSSAFLLPAGSNNNRVIAPGSEDLHGSANRMGRVFMVGTRPGMMYDTSATFAPAVQIDPILPVSVRFSLEYPDGRVKSVSGTGDATGSFAGTDRWPLDVAGIYRFHLDGDWNGHAAIMPGLPPDGGFLYVIEKDKPASAPEMHFNLPTVSTFEPSIGLHITGTSTADMVSFAAIIPGAVIDQGTIPVVGGRFDYFWSPKAANLKSQTYDITNHNTGAAQLADIVHLNFFSAEKALDGSTWHSFQRVVLRGNQAICTK